MITMANATVDLIAKILVIVGGINWGLTIFDLNLVTLIFRVDWLVNVVYALVAISALYLIKELKQ